MEKLIGINKWRQNLKKYFKNVLFSFADNENLIFFAYPYL